MSEPTIARSLHARRLSLSCAVLAAVCAGTVLSVRAATPDATESGFWGEPRDLLEKELEACWEWFSSEESPPAHEVWKRKVSDNPGEVELICTGNPRGFLHTKDQYADFDLQFEWRYASDPNGNSGVLIFTQNDARLWPTSIQVQLHQPVAGSVFPVGDAVTDATVSKEGLARAVGEWNQCRIVSRNGTVVVHINGRKAGEVTGCRPSVGSIAIQSEGSEVHFRRMRLRLPAAPEPDGP